MPFDTTSTQNFVAYVCTDEGATVAQAVLDQSGASTDDMHGGGLSGAARLCTDTQIDQTILAELGNIPAAMAAECVQALCASGARVIVLGTHTDIETYRALIKAGALEYFAFPTTAAEILSVQMHTPSNVIPLPPRAALSPSIAVMGSNGGVGTSLLAQNLAFHASSLKGAQMRTALLDADLEFGSQAIDLDREETSGLFEALMAPDRIDATFLNATMDAVSDHLSIYSDQVRIGQDATPYQRGLPHILPPLRSEFDAVITDLPRAMLMQHAQVADHLDALVLVIPAGFAGVNAATRLIERIKAQAPDMRILPVVSQLRRDAGLSSKDIARTIGHDIIATLPRCDAPLMRASRAARAMVQHQPRSPYAKAVAHLWDTILASPQKSGAPRRPLLKRMFR